MLSQRTLIASLLIWVALDSSALAQISPQSRPVPSEAELSESALAAVFGPVPPEARSARLGRSQARLASRLQTSPLSATSATVVLRKGMDATTLAKFVQTSALEVTRIEAKVPAKDGSGTVHTISIGAESLVDKEGDLVSRIARGVAQFRAQFYQLSNRMPAQSDEGRRFRELALEPSIRFYKFEAVATAGALNALQRDAKVSAIVVDDTDLKVTDLALRKQTVSGVSRSQGIRVRAKPGEGPPRGVPGVPDGIPVLDRYGILKDGKVSSEPVKLLARLDPPVKSQEK